jgi:molecular chaperone GrpE
VENEELSQLFSEAMEATDRRAEEARVARSDPEDDAEEFEDEFDLDVEIDQTSLNLDVNYLQGQMSNTSPEAGGTTTEGDGDDSSRETAAKTSGLDTTSQIEELLSSSFGGIVSDDDPDLAFPDFGDEDEEEGGMPAGALAALSTNINDEALSTNINDEALAIAEQQTASLRRQFNQVSRTLAERELELQTAQDRVTTLEAQVVLAARQTASTGREFQSFRQRAEREQEDARKFAAEKLLKDLLGVLDNLERALEHAGEYRDSALGTGVEMTLEQFIGILDRAGASRVDPADGTSFDPNFHEAVGQEQHESIKLGSIVRVLQKGLVLNGRLVRAAMVVVSTVDGSAPAPEAGESSEAAAAPTDVPKKKKKKRRKKRKPTPTDEPGEGLEAAAVGEDPVQKKKKKRKRKRKDVSADATSSAVEQTNSEQPAEE